MFANLRRGIHVLANTMLKWQNSEMNLIICEMEPMGCMVSIIITPVTFLLGPSQVYAWLDVVYQTTNNQINISKESNSTL
jgi:hypothetical protein